MGDFSKYLSSQEQLRDYQTGEVRQNPNLFGNPYRKVDKKKNPGVWTNFRTDL